MLILYAFQWNTIDSLSRSSRKHQNVFLNSHSQECISFHPPVFLRLRFPFELLLCFDQWSKFITGRSILISAFRNENKSPPGFILSLMIQRFYYVCNVRYRIYENKHTFLTSNQNLILSHQNLHSCSEKSKPSVSPWRDRL